MVDKYYIEKLIHDEAATGAGGFALDEFNDDGSWSRKLMYSSMTLVMKDSSNGDIIGAAIIGETNPLNYISLTMFSLLITNLSPTTLKYISFHRL